MISLNLSNDSVTPFLPLQRMFWDPNVQIVISQLISLACKRTSLRIYDFKQLQHVKHYNQYRWSCYWNWQGPEFLICPIAHTGKLIDNWYYDWNTFLFASLQIPYLTHLSVSLLQTLYTSRLIPFVCHITNNVTWHALIFNVY